MIMIEDRQAMMRKCFLIIMILVVCLHQIAFSQQSGNNEAMSDDSKDLHFSSQIIGGFNVGVSMPFPVPNRLSNFSWTPPFTPYIGWKMTLYSNKFFGITTGLFFGSKGMNTKASVYQLYTEVEVDNIYTKGYFTGRNETNVNNLYLTFPVELCFIKSYYRIEFGTLFSYSIKKGFGGIVYEGYLRRNDPTGDRIEIDSSPYNFDSEVRNFDIALTADFQRKIVNKLYIDCGIDWSFTPLLNSDFNGVPYKMYNIYAHIGVAYYLREK